MENKIDIAAILKDCPRGMELDCAIYDGVTLDSVVFESEYHYENTNTYPIKIVTENGFSTRLTKYGQNVDISEAKCVIFPKGKTTWEGFQKPFKDGDIISDNHFDSVCIFKGEGNIKGTVDFYCGICGNDGLLVKNIKDQDEHFGEINEYNFATEEEKEKLFNAIKDNGYKWNAETKTLEKLIVSKFKVGDRIKHKTLKFTHVITGIKDEYYIMDEVSLPHGILPIEEQNEYELVPNKFDINTLKTFDQVLVRLTNNCVWMPKLFSHYATGPNVKYYPFVTIDNIGYPQCVPYNGNEHLCRTTNNCDEFYRVWEK